MTVTLVWKESVATKIAIEFDNNCFYARVYENCEGQWYKTHESNPYLCMGDVERSWKRFVKKYYK